jgi:hypothetical protein
MVSPTPISIIISTSKIRYDHIEGAFYASKLCSKFNIKNNFLGEILLEYLCYSSFFGEMYTKNSQLCIMGPK